METDSPLLGIAHPNIGRGGSECALMWAVDALRDSFKVHILTTGSVDIASLNALYGTSVPPDEITVVRSPLSRLFGRVSKAAALRGHWHQRFCRRIAHRYDVLFSAYNLCDFGRPAIQRIADFSWDPDVRASVDTMADGNRSFHQKNILNRVYLKACRLLSPPSGRDMFKGDILIANSEWTASVLKEKHGATRVQIIYPPVPGEAQGRPWEKRAPDFVCLGRISREKRVEHMIAILAAVRAKGHDLRFHIIGGVDGSAYARELQRLARGNGEWVRFHGEQRGEEKNRLLANCRYGLHACPFEGFGIAVAEMARAGCIPFVPATGGAAEIVGHVPALIWANPDEAVYKIDAMLNDESQQRAVRKRLGIRAQNFSVSAYSAAIRQVVANMVETKPE